MKKLWPFLVGIAAVLAAGGALAVAIVRQHDAVPGALKDCLREAGLRPAKGPEAVQPLRRDAEAGRPLRGELRDVGEDQAFLLEQPDYVLLILRTPDNPSGDDLAVQAARDPSVFSVVALGQGPLRDVPAQCLEVASREA